MFVAGKAVRRLFPPVEFSPVALEKYFYLLTRIAVLILLLYLFKQRMHFITLAGIGRIIIYIIHFMRICRHVIHLPLVDIVIEMYELAVGRTYSIMALNRVLGRIFIIMVICRSRLVSIRLGIILRQRIVPARQ